MKKTYTLKPFYKISYSIFGILAVLFVYIKLGDVLSGKSDWQWNVLVAGFAVVGLVFVYNLFFEKLTISEFGIEHRSFMRRVFLRWNEIKEIPVRYSSKILIGKPSNRKKELTISLYLFVNNPIDSDLGQQIKHHAPHLFEKEKSV